MTTIHDLKKNYIPVKVPKLNNEDMQWFREAKFGMFIHWGLYSLLGRGEWVMFNERLNVDEYSELKENFDASGYDPKEWARVAKEAGMRYMVLTTKHHDGFSLFDSKANPFNSINSAARRDIVAEYVEACRSEGLKVGFYYSPMDWRFPGYFFPEMYLKSALDMKEQCWAQIRELMTNYGKIDMLWYDGEWLAHGGIKWENDAHGKFGWYTDTDWAKDEIYFKVNYFWESEKLNAMVRELQPGIMINNRSGWDGDFHVRERRIGDIRTDKPWDSNDCLTESWGWIPGKRMLSLRECVKNLVSIVVRDGNYLLNLGPMGNGAFEMRQVQRISMVGEWLKQYGEAIYATRGGPIAPGKWGGATYKDNVVFLHITEWIDDTIVLPGIKNKIVSYECMTFGHASVTQYDDSILVTVPIQDRHPLDTIIKLVLDTPVEWEGVKEIEQDIYGLADGLYKEETE